MKVVLIDNHDSFTYNIVQYVERILGEKISIFKNDAVKLDELETFDKIILSPGPATPNETTNLKAVIQNYYKTKSILGICLGNQAIAEVFGGKIYNTQQVFHGIATEIEVLMDDVLFKGLPDKMEVGRYHSWLVSKEGFPFDELEITAIGENDEIMSLRHKNFDLRGVQFHPESILTPEGYQMLENWLLN